MTKDEAMKLALEALELHAEQYPHMQKGYTVDAITALRQALEQPEQELTGRQLQRMKQQAWKKIRAEDKDDPELCFALGFDAGYDAVARRVEPPEMESGGGFESRPASLEQPEQEPVDSAEKASAYLDARLWEFIDMAAAWPQAKPDPRTWGHVLVYAPKRQEQEPVAWADMDVRGEDKGLSWTPGHFHKTPLYTAPPKREWVGLTDDEVNEFAAGCHLGNSVQGAIYKAQAKLKEKNT